jgi:D-alanyl-D-alanine carboxypeptidase
MTSAHAVERRLFNILTAATEGRGSAAVAVIDRAGGEPLAVWLPDSADEPVFLAYSITKTFTAALVLLLCDESRLSLDDRLSRWFPGIAQSEEISLRRLLNHTAGLPDYGGLAAYHESVRSSPSVPWTFGRYAAETFEKGLLFAPGAGWSYSNPGYMLLKRILELVTEHSYRDLISERIARPLGLARTFVPETVADLAGLAPGTSTYLSPDGSPRDVRSFYHPGWVSHGVVAAPASEIALFLDRLFEGRLLSRRSLDQMMEWIRVPLEAAGPVDESGPFQTAAASYGLGLMGGPRSRWGVVAGHSGGGPCYRTCGVHISGLGGVTVCVMGAIEQEFNPERVVGQVLEALAREIPPNQIRESSRLPE